MESSSSDGSSAVPPFASGSGGPAPIRKRRFSSVKIQPTRVKKVMQSDEEIGRMVASVPVAIGRAMEHFAERLLESAARATLASNQRTLTAAHIKMAAQSTPHFGFLEGLLKDVGTGKQMSEWQIQAIGTPSTSADHPVSEPPTTSRGRGRGRSRAAAHSDHAEFEQSGKQCSAKRKRKGAIRVSESEDDGTLDHSSGTAGRGRGRGGKRRATASLDHFLDDGDLEDEPPAETVSNGQHFKQAHVDVGTSGGKPPSAAEIERLLMPPPHLPLSIGRAAVISTTRPPP